MKLLDDCSFSPVLMYFWLKQKFGQDMSKSLFLFKSPIIICYITVTNHDDLQSSSAGIREHLIEIKNTDNILSIFSKEKDLQ